MGHGTIEASKKKENNETQLVSLQVSRFNFQSVLILGLWTPLYPLEYVSAVQCSAAPGRASSRPLKNVIRVMHSFILDDISTVIYYCTRLMVRQDAFV